MADGGIDDAPRNGFLTGTEAEGKAGADGCAGSVDGRGGVGYVGQSEFPVEVFSAREADQVALFPPTKRFASVTITSSPTIPPAPSNRPQTVLRR